MKLTPVKSESIAAIGYDAEKKVLHVQFQGGSAYAYRNVLPHQHEALMKAKSIGGHFSANIRSKFKSSKLG